MNTDYNLWKIIQNGNSKKSLGRDSKGGIIILPPVSFEEHVVVQRETKSRTLLLQSLLEDHMADFNHLDDAREIWLAVKARALPLSWSQVALTLKTRGGLEYLSFDDLYNKLRSLEIDVNGGSSYGSRSTTVAPTHSAFIGAASTNTKMVYSDQPSYSSLIFYTPVPSGSIMEDVLHSFVAENKPTQQLAYEDFEQVDQLEMEELDIKWQITKDQQLGHFARECNVKKVDEKARYSAFKISETEEAQQVYGLMARFESDFAIPAGNAAGGVNPTAVEFAMMGNSPKLLPKSNVKDPSLTNDLSSCSFKENVKPPRNLCNKSGTADRIPCKNTFVHPKKCFVCGTSISDGRSIPAASRNGSASLHAGRSIPAASRNESASIHAGRSIPTASRNGSASIHAGRSIHAASRNKPASIHAGKHIPADLICSGVPKTMVDLINLHGFVYPHVNKDISIVDSGCSRSMTGNREKLDDFVQVKGGTVTFGGGDGKITGRGTIRTSKLDFKNVYYVEELQNFNLFSVSQICDKKNKVLFTDAECLVLTKEFQLPDESQVVLRISRRHDLYTFNLSDIQPEQYINCLLAKASLEESTK
uniref:Ribonuclease H-like domain-containing protein n=1 Tax=Tanacetum cinerariifolium TaxID=118510 RepID=A0A6L2JPX9_TANCI|nr:ribonuclease H-like domain-containing protein [Tanacetum cinerariifolium]